MLLFLNMDCVLNPSTPQPGEARDSGLRGLESVLEAWPQLRVVITSACRNRVTIDQFRRQFLPGHRHRVIGTTALCGDLGTAGRTGCEGEILEWLRDAGADPTAWVALDDRVADFGRHAGRLIPCDRFTEQTAYALHAALRALADARAAPAPPAITAGRPARALNLPAAPAAMAPAEARQVDGSPAALRA